MHTQQSSHFECAKESDMEAFSHCRAIDNLLGLFTSFVALLKVCGTEVLVML